MTKIENEKLLKTKNRRKILGTKNIFNLYLITIKKKTQTYYLKLL